MAALPHRIVREKYTETGNRYNKSRMYRPAFLAVRKGAYLGARSAAGMAMGRESGWKRECMYGIRI